MLSWFWSFLKKETRSEFSRLVDAMTENEKEEFFDWLENTHG